MARSARKLLTDYYAWKEDIGAPSLALVDSQGLKYDKQCRSCPSKTRHYSSEKKHYVCGHCGDLWPAHLVTMFKGDVQKPKIPHQWESSIARMVDVGRQLDLWLEDQNWYWSARFYIGRCVLELSWPDLMDAITGWPEAKQPGSITSLRRRVADAEKEWARRLRVAGITRYEE